MTPFESEALYRRLVDHAPLGVLSVDLTGRIRTVNRRLLAMLGSTDETFTRSINLLTFPPLVEAGISEVARRCLETGEDGVGELPYASAWDRSARLRFHFAPLRGSDGAIEGVHAMVEDVTGQREAESALRESRRMLRLVLDTIPTRVFWKDRDLRYLGANRVFAEDGGLDDPDKLIGLDDFDLGWFEQADRYRADDRQVIESGRAKLDYEEPQTRPDGSRSWLRTSKIPLRDGTGHVVGVLGTYEDITERKRTEAELQWRSEFGQLLVRLATDFLAPSQGRLEEGLDRALQAVLDFTGDDLAYVVELSEDGRRAWLAREVCAPGVESRRAAIETLPLRELIARSDLAAGEIVHFSDMRDRPGRRSVAERTRVRSLIGLPLTRDGRLHGVLGFAMVSGPRRWSADGIRLLRVLGEIIGNTLERERMERERERLQEQLRQSQKMEAVGTLAGGIAHDFNNLLLAILGYNDLVLDGLPEDTELRRDALEVRRAAERARQLVGRILTFGRRAESEPRPVDLVPLVREALDLLRAGLPSTIAIEAELPDRPVVTRADPSGVHQVVMNVGTNAGQAMPDGGVLHVMVRAEEQAGWAHLRIRDTGCGLDRETAQRIFEPYFTTKESGRGSGLGLAVVHGIVSGLGGAVEVESRPGEGATFDVRLPLCAEPAWTEATAGGVAPRGRERVLFVDDEPAIRRWGERALAALGYEAESCGDGDEALERIEAERFDAVVTDQTMPRRTGLDLARALWERRPGIPVVLLTGLLDPGTAEGARAVGVSQILAKPLTRDDLARALRAALDAG